MDGFSFIDPFSHIITFLGALIHEIAYIDKEATARRLSQIEDGARRRRDSVGYLRNLGSGGGR